MMNLTSTPVAIVAAMSRTNRGIGNNNKLLWHIPADLKRFKELTLGKPIIMGRKTFESIIEILGKPLPGRTNIVVTRNPEYEAPGAIIADSLETAFAIAERENPTEIHIGGGAELYKAALPYTDKLYLTFIEDEQPADTFFPDYNKNFTEVKRYPTAEHNGLSYQWVDFEQKK